MQVFEVVFLFLEKIVFGSEEGVSYLSPTPWGDCLFSNVEKDHLAGSGKTRYAVKRLLRIGGEVRCKQDLFKQESSPGNLYPFCAYGSVNQTGSLLTIHPVAI